MPTDEEGKIEAGDGSSSKGSDFESADTFSVDSSITQYRIENGRRYHAYKDGQYVCYLISSPPSPLPQTVYPASLCRLHPPYCNRPRADDVEVVGAK
ncbi:hypothetical protein PZA11_002446 [Diplocarpon coronariae]